MSMVYGGNPKPKLRLHNFLSYFDGVGEVVDCHSCGEHFLSQREHAKFIRAARFEPAVEFYHRMKVRRGEATYE